MAVESGVRAAVHAADGTRPPAPRAPTFVGSFVALSLGVALIAVTGLALASSLDAPDRKPERFAAAPVVVRGQDTLAVPTAIGDRTRKLAQPRPVPADAVTRLRALGTVVEDRSFAVRAEGGPAGLVGHPWSTAAFAPYALDAGRAPEAADEVVVSGDWARPGTRVRTDRGTVRGTGTVAGLGFEDAVFYTDTRAAELSPWQVLRLVGAEALVVVRVGGLLGALVAGLNLAGMWSALGLLSVRTSVEIPWATLAAVLGACAVLAVVSAVAPAGLLLRRRAGEPAGTRQ